MMSRRSDISKPATLKDVAKRAGISTAVVSYVVNSGPRNVAPATKRRVLEAIEELRYRPNRAARTLASNRSHAIGLVVPDTTNAFFSDLARAVERRASAEGLITLVGNTDYDRDRELGYVEAFGDYGADGIIVVSADLTTPWNAAVVTPLVFLHRRPVGARGPVVRADDRRGGKVATQHLLRLGRGPVHCVSGFEQEGPLEDRVRGWHDAMELAEVRSGEDGQLLRVSYPRAAAAAELDQWIRGLPKPTAVFMTTDEQAIGLLAAAHSADVRIPQDVAVLAFDGTSAAATAVPSLTSIAMPYDRLAGRAIDHIVGRIPADNDSVESLRFVLRESCGMRRGASTAASGESLFQGCQTGANIQDSRHADESRNALDAVGPATHRRIVQP